MTLSLLGLFILQLVLLFYISRLSIRYLFYLLHRFFSSDQLVYMCIAIIFFPGTVIHELSHFMMAIILMLKVRELHVFPQMDKGYIKLGRVIYEKKDVLRSIIVGIAPIIVGLLFFWWMSLVNVLDIDGIFLKALVIYIIFVISSTMFSSKQDLVDLIYIIPIFIIIGIIFYFFPIDFSFITQQTVVIDRLNTFLYDVNSYLFISLVIHIILVVVLFFITRLSSRRS